MLDKVIGVFTLALVVTAVGVAVAPGSQAPKLISTALSGFSSIQKAAYGPQ